MYDERGRKYIWEGYKEESILRILCYRVLGYVWALGFSGGYSDCEARVSSVGSRECKGDNSGGGRFVDREREREEVGSSTPFDGVKKAGMKNKTPRLRRRRCLEGDAGRSELSLLAP